MTDDRPDRPVDRLGGAMPVLGLLALGLLVRLALALVILPDAGHRSDLAILTDWTRDLVANGPGAFYRPDSGHFADYPPAYLTVLWAMGHLGAAWSATFGGPEVTPFLLKLPFIAADLAAAGVLFLLTRHLAGRRAGFIATAIFLFNPGVILVSTIWAQNDSIATLVVLAALYLLVTGRTELAAAAAVVALLVKFQYGFAVPIVAIVGLRRHVFGLPDQEGPAGVRDLRRVGLSMAAGVIALVVVSWPFGLRLFDGAEPAYSLVHRFVGASQAFPGVTQNAFNLWMNPLFDVVVTGSSGLTEGHVVDDAVAALSIAGVAVTWQWIGNLLFIAAVVLALAVLARRSDGPTVVFVALVIAVAFFTLPTRVHERYLYPALALGLPLLACGASWRRLYAVLSVVLFLDVYWVYTLPIGNAGPGRGLLADTVYAPAGIYLTSAATVVAMAWLVLRTAGRIRAVGRSPADDAERRSASWEPVVAALSSLAGAIRHRWSATTRVGIGLVVLSVSAAVIAARVQGPDGPWLWNLDLPKIQYPLASLFHEALAAGRLPLWDDRLGLGFPLYAEGQIGAFYPPNWLLFRLPPLDALDATRVVHLAAAGVGAGLLVLRLAGSPAGAAVAALTAVLGGAITTKLEWHNLVAAYAFAPWILLPLVRRPAPTRIGLAAAGIMFGIQALAGHPNTWLLTGLTAAVVLVATAPRPRTIARILGFGLLGAAVGAVQLIPTALLTTLSVRSRALSPDDLFTSAATPFDLLGFAFAAPFARVAGGSWDPFTGWYPDGTFALLEAGAYVGLPVLALAAIGLGVRRSRPLAIAAVVLLAIAVVAAFRPEPWTAVPVLNALRSPVRAYVFVALLLGVIAGVGIGRLGRVGGIGRQAAAGVAVAAPVILLALVVGLVVAKSPLFDQLLLGSSTFLGPGEVAERRDLALAALTAPWPLAVDLAAGFAILAVIRLATVRRVDGGLVRLSAALAVGVPLALLGPLPNPTRDEAAFSSSDSTFVRAVAAADPARVLTLEPPGFYAGMPNQLAIAGMADLRMFSSLDLLATADVTEQTARADPDGVLRRALGVDVVVTFGRPCPGRLVAEAPDDGAFVCRDPDALRPPYWLPAELVTRAGGGSPVRPADASVVLGSLADHARPATVTERGAGSLTVDVDAPADGYVWIDRAWWPAWRTEVDGRSVDVLRALGGQLVPVESGRHVVVQAVVPWEAALGFGIGILGMAIAVGWVRRYPLGSTTIVTSDVIPA
ncbi:MAG TPA: hypothetical protein VFR14_14180 [Candidatus Limnocylindrales bacterium]|nr:hypothetical protein [Candidatus Limnocylindrales bacterium]